MGSALMPTGHEHVTLGAVMEMMRGLEARLDEKLDRDHKVLEKLLSRLEALEENVSSKQAM
jgi:hypothetical protein